MYATGSDLLDLDVVKLLVERGADINAKVTHKLAAIADSLFSTSQSFMATRRWCSF